MGKAAQGNDITDCALDTSDFLIKSGVRCVELVISGRSWISCNVRDNQQNSLKSDYPLPSLKSILSKSGDGRCYCGDITY